MMAKKRVHHKGPVRAHARLAKGKGKASEFHTPAAHASHGDIPRALRVKLNTLTGSSPKVDVAGFVERIA